MYEDLIAAIREVIKTNGREEITGQVLQNSLVAMIRTLGDGFNFAGVKTVENDNPDYIPQNPVFYIVAPGLYAAHEPEPGETEPYHDSRNIEEGTFEVWTFDGSNWGYYPVDLGSAIFFVDTSRHTMTNLVNAWDNGKIIVHKRTTDVSYIAYTKAYNNITGKHAFVLMSIDDSRAAAETGGAVLSVEVIEVKEDTEDQLEVSSVRSLSFSDIMLKSGGTFSGNVVANGHFDFNGYTYFRQIADFIKTVIFRDSVQFFGHSYAKGAFEIGVDDSSAQGDLPVYNRTVKIIDKTSSRKPTLKFVRSTEGDTYPDAQILADNTGLHFQREVGGVMTDLVLLNSNRFEYNGWKVGTYYEGSGTPADPAPGMEWYNTDERALYKFMGGLWHKIWQDPNV